MSVTPAYLSEAGLSSKSIKWNSDLDWFPKMTWEYHFQALFPECQILCIENKHKSITDWLTDWNCLSFFNRRKIKQLAVYSFFLTFCTLTQWYAGSYEIVFRISTTSANHFLKVFMLACKSILLKFHLRYWYNGFLGHKEPKLPPLATSVNSQHGFDHRCNKDNIHESKVRLILLKLLIAWLRIFKRID